MSDVTLEEVTCPGCGEIGDMEIEWRDTLVARPLGTFSLAGQQLKVSADWARWPWLVCLSCGFAVKGER